MTILRTLSARLLAAVALLLVMSAADSPAQGYRFRLANLVEGVPNMDAYLNTATTPYLSDVALGWASALSASFNGPLVLKLTPADGAPTAPLLSQTIATEGDRIYSFIAYGTTAAPKLAALPWRFDQQAPAGSAVVRVLNAAPFIATGIDVHFDSVTATPAINAIAPDSASLFFTVPAHSASIIVTAAGSTTPVASFVAPIADRSVQTLIVRGTSAANLEVRAMTEGRTLQDPAELAILQREASEGAVPTLRFINAFPQPDARRLDVYLAGSMPAATGVNYRGASSVLPGIGVGATGITLVPEGRSRNDSVYGTTLTLARDTAYALILTQFRSGAAVTMPLARSISEAPPAAGMAKIRIANVTDFETGLTFNLSGSQPITETQPQFLTATPWREVPAGQVMLEVMRPGGTTPIFEGTYTIAAGSFLTLLPIGDDTRFTVDVLDHSNQGPQQPLASFGDVETGVRSEIAAATRALRLSSRPNPVTDDARITFTLPGSGDVTLELYDMLGRGVRTLASGHVEAGDHSVALDASGLASGRYTAVLRAGSFVGAIGVVVAADGQ